MKRLQLFLLLTFGCVLTASADHITGGEIYYTYAGTSAGYYQYDVTVKFYMRCNSGREFNNPTIITVFDRSNGTRINDYIVNLDHVEKLSMVHNDPCISNPPVVCYDVGFYRLRVSVPPGTGFTITAHVNFRIDGINNLMSNYERVGATYTGDIPASDVGSQNNSARFTGEDLVVVCADNTFSYSFAASDPDGDELRYSFCEAYRTDGGGGFGASVSPPPPPPYNSVPYGNNFSGSVPLGGNVKIDAKTGLITGIAPARGIYVVTVCVQEIRNGEVIAVQRKDLQINIAPCSITAAALPEEFMLCDTSQTLIAKNMSTSPLVQTYSWELSTTAGEIIFETDKPEVRYTFADTGLYNIKLVINRNQQCSDTTMSLVRVYPGFKPEFEVSHPCISRPVLFTDKSTSRLGTVSGWEWDFGEATTTLDFSTDRSPTYAYPAIGAKHVMLIARDSKGCVDTVTKLVDVYDKPPISLAFRDTLICPPDAIQLRASGNGTFKWTSVSALSDPAASDPVVSPLSTSTYYIELDDAGCTNTDSVKVRVVNKVSLQAMEDETICEGDSVRLNLSSDGLKYTWSPAVTLNDPTLSSPTARPAGTTTYQVTAFISSCSSTDDVTINTVPYPIADAGADTTICFNTQVTLQGRTDGSSFNWSPAAQLFGVNTLNPVAKPLSTTRYLFFAYDTKGCPKPGIDSVVVTVNPEVRAFAGNDTVVVVGQPLQMKATGGVIYSWSPASGLSDPGISDPVANFSATPAEGYYRYKVMVSDEIGCVDSAYIQVQIFASGPEIYVPNAFTPNGDGKNDFFRVVAAGIQKLEAFRLYNRWGQVMFDSPASHSQGWDGNYGGKPQPADTYVWVVKATDYLGRAIFKRGTFVLIR
jgi:gliding motility-associated-like protein